MAGLGAPKGMIFLDPHNKIITDYFTKKFEDPASKEVASQRFSEFDDVTCMITKTSEEEGVVYLSAVARCWEYIEGLGVMDVLSQYYGPLLLPTAEAGFNVTLRVDVTAPPFPKEVIIDRVSLLRTMMLGAPFFTHFRALVAGVPLPPCLIPYRGTDTLYLIPREDHIAVVFMLNFEDITERNIARVIAQELAEAKVGRAPPVNFSPRDPPAELLGEGAPPVVVTPSLIGFITFSVMRNHVDSAEKETRVATLLSGFRTYVSYHIKATKAFLHSRMRLRVDKMLQVLNRAVPEDPFSNKAKKLITGKTFVRK